MTDYSHCPTCKRYICDDDMKGCEAPTGQRYCLEHLPREAYPDLYDDLGLGR